MTRQFFRVEVRSAAAKERVFAVLSDASKWNEWARPMVRQSSWEREGTPAPGGVGAVRRVGAPPSLAREEIVAYEPPTRMAYVLLSGMPVRDYRAEVELSDAPDGGTTIAWRGNFVPRYAGSGLAMRMVMRGIIAFMARRLAAYAAERMP